MALIGASVEDLRRLSSLMAQSADRLSTSVLEPVSRLMDANIWLGQDSVRFHQEWQSSLAPRMRSLAGELDRLAGVITQQADEQEQASAASGTTLATPSAQHRKPPDFDSSTPASAEQIKEIALRMRVLKSQHADAHFPQAYAAAEAWATELGSGNPTSAQVEAFRRYCFLMAIAHINRSGVEEAATIACDSLESADNAKLEAVISGISLGMGVKDGWASTPGQGAIPVPSGSDVLEAAIKTDIDKLRTPITEQLVHALQEREPAGFVAAYDQQSDSYLASLVGQARSTTEFWGPKLATSVMSSQTDLFNGRLEELRYDQLDDSSTNFMTGDGSDPDRLLRGIGGVIRPLGIALDASAALGNVAHAVLASGTGQHALEIATNEPMENLQGAAQMYGFR